MSSPSVAANARPTALARPADAARNPQSDDAVDIASIAGLDLFDWQADFLDGSTSVRDSDPDRWAAREVACVVPRQNGKGAVLEARQLAGLFVFKERLQIHSAHEFKTAYEHFRRLVALVESTPLLNDQVKIIRTGAGDQSIELKDGCRIRFIARSRTSGRGFSADTVYLDEAFVLHEETIGALLYAMSARPNGQIWYTSSAPHADSDVLHRIVGRIRHPDPDARFYGAEWANDASVDLEDRAAWYRANPSLGLLIDEDFVATELRASAPEEFLRERLGVPDSPSGEIEMVVAEDKWRALIDPESMPAGEVVLSLDVSPDRQWATFALAGRRDDGLLHVVVRDRRPGLGWVVDRAAELAEGHGARLAVEVGGPAGPLVPELVARRVDVVELTARHYTSACAQFFDAVESGVLRHRGQPELWEALLGARTSPVGDAWKWSRRRSGVDITPLVAASLAVGVVAGVDAGRKVADASLVVI